MSDHRDMIAAWVARHVLPHETSVRRWLSRKWGRVVDVDDVIQEAYCRIATLRSIDHIEDGRAYFFRTAQTAALDTQRRHHTGVAGFALDTDLSDVLDEEPLAERTVAARQELQRVTGLLANLSATCRRVIELRRIEGLSQRETAQRLGVSEGVVENNIARGIRSVLRSMLEEDMKFEDQEERVDAQARFR